jgi:hypothetical protein
MYSEEARGEKDDNKYEGLPSLKRMSAGGVSKPSDHAIGIDEQ